MKTRISLLFVLLLTTLSYSQDKPVAAEVVITPYKTTLIADGKDSAVFGISIVDKAGTIVPDAENLVAFYITGDAKIISSQTDRPFDESPERSSDGIWKIRLYNGRCTLVVQSGTTPDMVHFEARSTGLHTGSTDIITVSPQKNALITLDKTYALNGEAALPRPIDKMLGADISFLPELEAKGVVFSDNGIEKDAIQILKDHGFNYIRLRIFNQPANEKGYSPKKGFCDLEHTKKMAKRVKAAGMKLLLDFHYSDTWADPGKQFKPKAWEGKSFKELKKALYQYTENVIQELKDQGTTPDMVQIGNEINHGIVWPEGNVNNPDGMAQLYNAGTAAVKKVDPTIPIMLHVALGGQHLESVSFIDGMLSRGAHFDVIGQSYYPKWHGTIDDLQKNLNMLARRYNKDIIIVEYSQLKEEVNHIAFEIVDGHGKGSCIWEPLNTWEAVFEKDGSSNKWLGVYDKISKRFMVQQK